VLPTPSHILVNRLWNNQCSLSSSGGPSIVLGGTMSQTSPVGIISDIYARGSGQRSAQVLIRLQTGPNDYPSFFLMMPTPNTPENREKFLTLLRQAYEKMWEAKKVKITSHEYHDDQVVDRIDNA
jgi:hypothetical protein